MATKPSEFYCDNPRCQYRVPRGDGSFFMQEGEPPNVKKIYSTLWDNDTRLCSHCASVVTRATGLYPLPEPLGDNS